MSSSAASPSLSLVPVSEVKEAISLQNRAQLHAVKDKAAGALAKAGKAALGGAKAVGNTVSNVAAPAVRGAGAALEGAGNKLQHRMDRSSAVKDPMQRRQLADSMKAQNPNAITPHLAGVTRRGAAATGALIGGGLGFLNPGTDEEGNTKSRLMSAASGAATGGTLGFGAGHLMKGQATRGLKRQFDKDTTVGASSPLSAKPGLVPATPDQP